VSFMMMMTMMMMVVMIMMMMTTKVTEMTIMVPTIMANNDGSILR